MKSTPLLTPNLTSATNLSAPKLSAPNLSVPSLAAPSAKRVPQTTLHHGLPVSDDYAWLRADNWQDVMRQPELLDTEIRDYLEAENAYTAAALAPTEALQHTLFQEMKARLKEDDGQVPQPHGPFEYFPRFVKGGQYAELCRIPRGGGTEIGRAHV